VLFAQGKPQRVRGKGYDRRGSSRAVGMVGKFLGSQISNVRDWTTGLPPLAGLNLPLCFGTLPPSMAQWDSLPTCVGERRRAISGIW